MYDRQALIDLYEARALKRGQFTLASGKQSTFYLDSKQVTLHSKGAMLVAAGMLELLAGKLPPAVGGLAMGADPITAAIITVAGIQNIPLLGFMVRKEPKGHGTQKFIEGPLEPGMEVVIVEDVVTTGGSALQAIERVEAFGCKVVQVVAIVDRLEGGEAIFKARGYPFSSLLTIRDFGIEPQQ